MKVLPGLLLVVLAALVAGQVSSVDEVTLPDQYGVLDRLAAHREHVVVAMVVTAKRLRNLKAWENRLSRRYDDLHYLRVLDVADVPEGEPVTVDEIAARLLERVPEEISVLIDLERRWAEALELDTARPNIIVFDREGRFVTSVRGREDSALAEQLFRAIDSLGR